MSVTASRIARAVAAREWPDVQRQAKIGRGVFGFSCAGHGGIVAVIGVADLPDAAVEAARAEGLTEFVVFHGGKVYYTAGDGPAPVYKREPLEAWAKDNPSADYFEVWVGEEDCAWATIVYADDSLRDGGVKGGYFSAGITREEVESSCFDWHPEYAGRLLGRPLTAAESSNVARAEWEEAHADCYVTRAAWGSWHENVDEGTVGVVAQRKRDGDEAYFLVSDAEYQAREGSFVVDEARHGSWIGPSKVAMPV